jgi:hypothetical protein
MLFDQNINREQWYGNQSFLPITSLEKKHYVNNTIRFIEFGLDSSDFYTYPKSLNLSPLQGLGEKKVSIHDHEVGGP